MLLVFLLGRSNQSLMRMCFRCSRVKLLCMGAKEKDVFGLCVLLSIGDCDERGNDWMIAVVDAYPATNTLQ